MPTTAQITAAVQAGDHQALRKMFKKISREKFDINHSVNNKGYLHMAIDRNDDVEMVKCLLKYGVPSGLQNGLNRNYASYGNGVSTALGYIIDKIRNAGGVPSANQRKILILLLCESEDFQKTIFYPQGGQGFIYVFPIANPDVNFPEETFSQEILTAIYCEALLRDHSNAICYIEGCLKRSIVPRDLLKYLREQNELYGHRLAPTENEANSIISFLLKNEYHMPKGKIKGFMEIILNPALIKFDWTKCYHYNTPFMKKYLKRTSSALKKRDNEQALSRFIAELQYNIGKLDAPCTNEMAGARDDTNKTNSIADDEIIPQYDEIKKQPQESTEEYNKRLADRKKLYHVDELKKYLEDEDNVVIDMKVPAIYSIIEALSKHPSAVDFHSTCTRLLTKFKNLNQTERLVLNTTARVVQAMEEIVKENLPVVPTSSSSNSNQQKASESDEVLRLRRENQELRNENLELRTQLKQTNEALAATRLEQQETRREVDVVKIQQAEMNFKLDRLLGAQNITVSTEKLEEVPQSTIATPSMKSF